MMKKLPILVALAVFVLSACAPQSPAYSAELFGETPAASETTAEPEATEVQETQPQEPDVQPTVEFAASSPATCTVVSDSILREPDPTEVALFPPVTEEDWTRGPDDAMVTFLIYSDFQCPFCSELELVLNQLHENYPDEVRTVFRHFPLKEIHDKAEAAAYAAEAAGNQGKFNELKDVLFTNQAEWSGMTIPEFEEWVTAEAEALDLDMAQFTRDMNSTEVKDKIQTAKDYAVQTQLPGTPFMLIDGRIYQGPRDYANLEAIVKLLNMEDQQFTDCPEMAIDPGKEYTATIETSKGEIVLDLFAKEAPMAVNNFVFLAENGWYDNTIFHRVLPGFVAQGGDPSGTGYGTPGYAFSNEVSPDLRFDQPGRLGMANAGPDSNGSQFFIVYEPQPQLDGQYTVFGQVIEGMDVLDQLTARDPSSGEALPEGDEIISVTIEEQ